MTDHQPAEEELGIIGRERALIDKLTKQLLDRAKRDYRTTSIRRLARGNYFEVIVADDRWIARVGVTLDRVEEQPVGE